MTPTKAVAEAITFCLFVALIVTAAMALLLGQARVPLATDMQKAFAPLTVSEDGRTVTFRETAQDDLRICVMADAHTFTRRICMTVGDVRSGRWGRK